MFICVYIYGLSSVRIKFLLSSGHSKGLHLIPSSWSAGCRQLLQLGRWVWRALSFFVSHCNVNQKIRCILIPYFGTLNISKRYFCLCSPDFAIFLLESQADRNIRNVNKSTLNKVRCSSVGPRTRRLRLQSSMSDSSHMLSGCRARWPLRSFI